VKPGAALSSLLGQSLGSLAAHPLRSALTALSVTFGAAVLFLLLAYASGIPETTADILRSMGSKEFLVEARRSRGPGSAGSRRGRSLRIRYADVDAIREACPSIAGLAPAYRPGRGGPVFTQDRSWPWAMLRGVGHEFAEVTGMRIARGRWFTPEEELSAAKVALISRPLADGMFAGKSPLGETVDAYARRFQVIGVYESKAGFAYSLIVPYPTAMEMGETGGRYVSEIAFAPHRPDLARAAISEIRSALGALYSFDPDDSSAIDVRENTAFTEEVLAVSLGLEALVLTIGLLTLVLGCLGAGNVVGIAVSERTAEIGLRKALGATAGRVRAEVLLETLLLCLFGGGLGVALGALSAGTLGELRFSEEAALVPQPDATLLLLAFGVLVATGVLSGLPAARRASRLEPIAALREE
jgi:putative ABC transport system permease protein